MFKKIVLFKGIILLIFIANGLTANSQEYFREGYIILNEGDTLKGWINNRGRFHNPEEVSFKNLESEVKVYSVKELKGFFVDNNLYKRATIVVDANLYKIEDSKFTPPPQKYEANVFLLTLVQGEKSLYLYRDKESYEYFYIRKGVEYELLRFRKYYKSTQDASAYGTRTQYTGNDKIYIGQLTLYFDDFPEIYGLLQSTDYKTGDLVSLFKAYYELNGRSAEYIKGKEVVKAEYGFIVGLSVSEIKFKSIYYDYLVNGDFTTSIDPVFGVNINLVFPHNLKRLSINNELLFYRNEFMGEYNEYYNENKYIISKSTIGSSYLKLASMIQYNYGIKKATIFINAGASAGISLSNTNTRSIENKLYTDHTIREEPLLDDIRRLEESFHFGLGASFKNLSFQLRAERGTGFSVYSNLGSPTTKLFFLLGYKF